MAFRVYILFSPSLKRHYVGFSSHHARRLRQHRREHSGWSSLAEDWIEIWNQTVSDRIAARELEVRIKARGAPRFLVELDVPLQQEHDVGVRMRV